MLLCIVGNIGSGKSLLMRILMIFCSRPILANFLVYGIENYKRLEIIDLINLPDNRDLFIDEGYTWLESRTSTSRVQRFISYLILQSRKRTIDIYVAVQLFGSIDLRFRQNADIIIMCECIKKKQQIEGFQYEFYRIKKGVMKKFKSLFVSYEIASLFFDLYDTFEIIPPKDYDNLILDILVSDIDKFKSEIDKRIHILITIMNKDNVPIPYLVKDLKGYMNICNIPSKYSSYIEIQLQKKGLMKRKNFK